MNKENILYGVIGLLAGLIVGYLATDSLNRSYATASPTAVGANAGGAAAAGGDNAALPPDHPPTGGAAAADAGGAQADVTNAIEQARKEPGNFAVQMKAADLFTQIQRYDGAVEFLERAVKIKPNDLSALVGLGNAYFDLKRYPEAERQYQTVLKLKPDDVNVRTDLGLSYFLREPRALDQAIAEYKTALKYNARHEQSLQNLAAALIAKGDKAAARDAVKRLEQVNAGNQALAQFREQLK